MRVRLLLLAFLCATGEAQIGLPWPGPGASAASSAVFGQSSATNTNIAAVTLVSSVPSTPGMYKLNWTVSLTTVGTSCTGTTTVVLNDVFTDPSAAGSLTNPIATVAIAANGNGTVGDIALGAETILAKNATAIQYSTTSYTAGAGCSVNPTYQVSYVVQAIH